MKFDEFILIWKETVLTAVRNPFVLIPGIFLWAVVFGFSKIGGKVAPSLQTTPLNVIWIVLFMLFLLAVLSLVSVFMISVSANAIETKAWNNELKQRIKKSSVRNFFVLLAYIIFFNLINLTLFAFTKIMVGIQEIFAVSVGTFRFLSTLIAFFWLAGVIIFFGFSNFFMTLKKQNFREGIRSSIRLVKKEYLGILNISVIFFILFSLVGVSTGVFGDFVEYVILVPFVFVLLTKIVLKYGK